ncbi:UNKNOWN [Stylonychia lemnae]|uniref:Origin recognition complex subunit 3 N-terminal domain-containing protein n=1 Tax=Stylonychia lemnae TaxID=5949 RepID=A0A078AXM2_STYLE|nr:UNKNOWN [Stylonychia lemnae]|eukprot:CDW86884.1 UNKNOWN [Stylonychia lemnae]
MQDYDQGSSIPYNTPFVEYWNKNRSYTNIKAPTIFSKDPQKYLEKQRLTDNTMRRFDEIIQNTMRDNNSALYYSMKEFMVSHNMNQVEFDSQVPTCLVITSSESASSIDTQFTTLCEELKGSTKAVNLVLDEKKCGNMKSTIDHIQNKLKQALGLIDKENGQGNNGSDTENFQPIKMKIEMINYSEESNDEDLDEDFPLNPPVQQSSAPDQSVDHVSSIRGSHLNYSMADQSVDSIALNHSVNGQKPDQEMEMVYKMSELKVEPIETQNSKQLKIDPSIELRKGKTRSQNKKALQQDEIYKIQDKEEQDNLRDFQEFSQTNDIILKESFFGIYNILRTTKKVDRNSPIILIIKNIKTFPHNILNDLIHLMKKYRSIPYSMKLNLMLGVQNNNKDEFHMRVKIQNCVKMTVKTFYFPCMKNIIFEVIYKLILSDQFIFTYDVEVIQNLVEIINVYGMSVMKFKRILKYLMAEFFLRHELFFIHDVQIGLLSEKNFQDTRMALSQKLKQGIDRFYSNHNELMKMSEQIELPNIMLAEQPVNTLVLEIVNQTQSFSKSKRKWLKAYEVIQDLVESIQDFTSNKERNIFKYQFLMNFLTKGNQEQRIGFLKQQLDFISNHKEYVTNNLIKVLQGRHDLNKSSKFRQIELLEIEDRLSGIYTLNRIQNNEAQTNSQMTKMQLTSKMSNNRKEMLLNNKQKQITVTENYNFDQNITENSLTEQQRQILSQKYAPKSETDYKTLLYDWIQGFINKYLAYNQNLTQLQKHLFFVGWNKATQTLNPDITGNMTKAIIDSGKILKCQCCTQNVQMSAKLHKDASNLEDFILPTQENMTIIMELYKYFGKEFNIVITYELFKKINLKITEGKNHPKYSQADIRKMFLVALQNLKFMGFFSPTKQSIFLFKKNFYGKASIAATTSKNDENDKNAENIIKTGGNKGRS